ncbi:unnamed protein product [Parnassius apollo]|uniref:(apollo) hypothetical protein n=1 Tax=Parnassius apollo TaxID=110799 RepID=A0A8S3YAN0_PARAO|nr:unnamed protein product [Parnassius apollo]
MKRGGGVNYFDSGPMAISTYFDECASHSRKEGNSSYHSNNHSSASVASVSECEREIANGACASIERVNETKIDHEMVRAGSEDEHQGRVAMTRSPEHQCSPVYYDSNIMNKGETDIKYGKLRLSRI